VVSEFLIVQLLRVDYSEAIGLISLLLAQGVFLDESLSEISELLLFRLLIFFDVSLHETSSHGLTSDRLRLVNHLKTLWHFGEGRRLQLRWVSGVELALLLHKFMTDAVFVLYF